MNVISSGENDVSCDAFKLMLLTYQSTPSTSKYNFASSKSSAIIFSVKFRFCKIAFDDGIFTIVCDFGVPFKEPLKVTFRKSVGETLPFFKLKSNVYSTPLWIGNDCFVRKWFPSVEFNLAELYRNPVFSSTEISFDDVIQYCDNTSCVNVP